MTSPSAPACRSRPCRGSSTAATASPRPRSPGAGGHRRPRLRVEPRRPKPAQPADQRDRHPRRRHRAVQRRAAEGRRARRSTRPTTSWSSTPAGHHRADGWERRYLSRLSGTLTDGTILVTPTVVEVASEQPVVAVDPHVGGSSLPTVDAENFEGAVAVTQHLIELGHRRIGFLAGRPDLESARRREAGYRAALEAAGIAFDPELVRVGGFTEATAEAPARELLTLAERPTAVFAANDLSAIQTMRPRPNSASRVPDDLSVVGFDNIPESALTDPPLTTVDQSIQALGHEAVRSSSTSSNTRSATRTATRSTSRCRRSSSSAVRARRRGADDPAQWRPSPPGLKSFTNPTAPGSAPTSNTEQTTEGEQ